MTDDDLTARLQQVLLAAQRRFRQQRGFGALVTPSIPDRLIDEVAHGLAPLLRELVREAVADQQAVVLRDSPGAAVTAYQCTECGEPLERGRCPDRECREAIRLDVDTSAAQAELDDLVGRLDALDVLELRDPPADPRSVLP